MIMSEFAVELPTKYKAEDYMKLDSDKRLLFDDFMQKQISYNKSLADALNSQAKSLKEEKEKISYERADPKFLPFLAYCWRVAAVAIGGSIILLGAILKLPVVGDAQLKLYAFIVSCIAIIMILGLLVPLRLLPKKLNCNACKISKNKL